MRHYLKKCSSSTNKIILSFPSSTVLLIKLWNFVLHSLNLLFWESTFFPAVLLHFPGIGPSVPGVSPGTCLLSFGHKGSFFPSHPQALICSFSFVPWVSLLFSLSFVVFVWLFWVIVHFDQPLPRHRLWHCCLPPPLCIPFQLPDVLNLCGFCIPALSS